MRRRKHQKTNPEYQQYLQNLQGNSLNPPKTAILIPQLIVLYKVTSLQIHVWGFDREFNCFSAT